MLTFIFHAFICLISFQQWQQNQTFEDTATVKLWKIVAWAMLLSECFLKLCAQMQHNLFNFNLWLVADLLGLPYKRKFSRGSNFRYFRERFENAKICHREKLYFKRKFRSWYWYDILLHTLFYLKSRRKSFGVITIQTTSKTGLIN